MRYIFMLFAGMMLLAAEGQENKEIFSHIKSFYFGVCNDDLRDADGMSISMYENGKDYIIIKAIDKYGRRIKSGYAVKASTGDMEELRQSAIKLWSFTHANLPQKLDYLGREFILVDSFKLGRAFVAP